MLQISTRILKTHLKVKKSKKRNLKYKITKRYAHWCPYCKKFVEYDASTRDPAHAPAERLHTRLTSKGGEVLKIDIDQHGTSHMGVDV